MAIFSALLLTLAWPPNNLTTLFVFFGLVPMLNIAAKAKKSNVFFLATYLALVCWNTGCTWWIWNSTDVGTIAAIGANSLLMCLPWMGYRWARQRFNKYTSYVSLVSFWCLFEYIHLNWQLSWPWLTLGNVFGSHPEWVQWYSITGVSGGTLWVLLANIFLYEGIAQSIKQKETVKKILPFALFVGIVTLPIVVSLLWGKVETGKELYKVRIVQPNIDPYEKTYPQLAQKEVEKLIRLSETNLDSNTTLVMWPETALATAVLQERFTESPLYAPVFAFSKRHPKLTILTGLDSYRCYGSTKQSTSAYKGGDGLYYDAFNAAVSIRANSPLEWYNKMKLVPGVEHLPDYFDFLSPLFEKFGGTTGSYGVNDKTVAFHAADNHMRPAPIICYESIYGEHVGSYVQNGANMLAIITNDAWWGNTPGHKQHLSYACLRAIETRCWVARSANTGVSALIDPYGHIVETRPWATEAVLDCSLPISTTKTFYVEHGDYLFQLFSAFAVLMLLWMTILTLLDKVKNNRTPIRTL